jgi:hypothetical protein
VPFGATGELGVAISHEEYLRTVIGATPGRLPDDPHVPGPHGDPGVKGEPGIALGFPENPQMIGAAGQRGTDPMSDAEFERLFANALLQEDPATSRPRWSWRRFWAGLKNTGR